MADQAWAWKVMKESDYKLDIEAVFALSHNAAIDTQIATKQREVADARREAHDSLEEHHMNALDREQSVTEREFAADTARRQAIAAALARLGSGYSAPAAAQSGPTIGTAPIATRAMPGAALDVNGPRPCSSDFACGIGFQCVKPNFSTQGSCMRSVNNF